MQQSLSGWLATVFLAIATCGAAAGPATAATTSVVYSFSTDTDSWPQGTIVRDPAGNLYGVAEGGTPASPRLGSIFELSPPKDGSAEWTETILYRFRGKADGFRPASLQRGADGSLYGVTTGDPNSPRTQGNSATPVIVFKLSPPATSSAAWTYTVLHRFSPSGTVASLPAGLTLGPDGVIYGAFNLFYDKHPFIYALYPPAGGTSRWTLKTLYTSATTDAIDSRFIVEDDGSLYGLSQNEIFKLSKEGASYIYTTLHANRAPGQTPKGTYYSGNLAKDANGRLYASRASAFRHPSNCSDRSQCDAFVFQLTPPAESGATWGFKVIYTFDYTTRGLYPTTLALMSGHLVGTTMGTQISISSACGNYKPPDSGLVFALAPPAAGQATWTEADLHVFQGEPDGAFPIGNFVTIAGNAYGITYGGGAYCRGTLYQLSF